MIFLFTGLPILLSIHSIPSLPPGLLLTEGKKNCKVFQGEIVNKINVFHCLIIYILQGYRETVVQCNKT